MSSKTKETDVKKKSNKKVEQDIFEIEIVKPARKTKKTTDSVKENKATKTKSKKSTTKKKVAETVKKTATKKAVTTKSKKTATSKTKKSTTTNKPKPPVEVVEYYDLPYRYNETLVKVLYQTPNTLFVYWDISDEDRENYINQYGQNFFNITRPVLIVHNITMNYSFEVTIDDFANGWYLQVNDSKCDYKVELGRRPNFYNAEAFKEIEENIHTNYIYITTSNQIESPNDHVLFNTNENNTIKFRNIKTSQEKSISLYDIVKRLPAIKNVSSIPFISEDLLKDMYSGIYNNEDISLFERIGNPSSGENPSSGSMSSRFI